jgi:hypothetical protein
MHLSSSAAPAMASYTAVGVICVTLSVIFVLLRLVVNLTKEKRLLAEDGK